MKRIFRLAIAALMVFSIILTQFLCASGTVITKGDLSVEEWIAAAEALNMDDYVSGSEEFLRALNNLKNAKYKYDNADNPELSAILELKSAWDNLKYEEKTAEPLFKGKTFSGETKVQLNTWDYSTGETKYIVLSEYSKFTLTLSTTGSGEYGNSLDVFFILKNGETTNRWWGGLWGSNSSAMDRTLDIAKTIEKAKMDPDSAIISLGLSLNNYGGETATFSDIYGYKQISAEYPENYESFTLAEWISAAKKLDLTKFTTGVEEFKTALENAELQQWLLAGGKAEEFNAYTALKEAWTNLKYSEKETVSLVNEKSGTPSQGAGFSAALLKTVNLSEYEKFDFVMDVQNYKNSGGGLSLNLQFANGGSTLNQWFKGTITQDTKTKTADEIKSTGVTEWKTIKIFGANSGYNKEITLKAIYGYKYIHAALPEDVVNMNLSEVISAAKSLDVSKYSSGTVEFLKAIAEAEACLKGTTVEELEAIEALKTAWLNLKKSEKETASLVNEKSGIPSQGAGFSAALLKTVNLSEYEKFDFVMDVQNYKNSGGGLSLNLQFANGGSTLNQWFKGTITQDTKTKTADEIKSTGVTEWKTIKIFGANSGYNKEITLKAIYGYKYVSPKFPEGYEDFSLSDWIEAAELLDTTGYLGADAFEDTLANVKSVESGAPVAASYSVFAVSGDLRNTTEVDDESRKEEAYKELSIALSNLKTAWKGLRTKEMYLIATPKNAIKNTDEDEVPSEFGDYAVYENVGITSKFNYQLVGGKVDFVGIDRIEIYLRAATLKDGKYKTPATTSFLLQINSAENGKKEIWSAVPAGATYGRASFNTSSQKNLQPYTEIGSDPVTTLDFMSGYDKRSSLVCDTLTLGGIYAIKYHTVPFPKGALLETSGADVSELSALVEHANKFNESDFSKGTWKPFKKALAQAKAVIDDLTAPQGTVDAAKEKLLSTWGELIYYQRVSLYDVAENIEWGLEIADNLVYPQYVSVSDKTLPAGITSYAKLTNVPSKWHKLCFRQMVNSDTKNFDFIELYTRYDTTLNRGDSGCFYFQINYNYQVWKGFPSSNTNGNWQQLLINLDDFTALKDKNQKFVDASGKIGSFSVSLTGGASGNFDISSANLIKCIKVEAGKDPVTEEISTSKLAIGEDFSNDVFDLRYEPADDGEKFELQKENTVSKPQEVKKENNITVIILISVVAAFVVFAAVTGIVIWRRKVK